MRRSPNWIPRLVHRPSSSSPERRPRRRSPFILVIIILLWSVGLGAGLAQASEPSRVQLASAPPQVGTVDPIPEQYELGASLYLENCATCHVGVPPQVFPRETWQRLLQDQQHYGVQLPALVDPPRILIWQYIQFFARALDEGEEIPYRVNNSRYFNILHPKVDLPRPTRLSSCATCHPRADQFNFRSLSPEWQDAP